MDAKRHEFCIYPGVDGLMCAFAVESDHQATGGEAVKAKWNWKTALGITAEFTRGDKIIYGITLGTVRDHDFELKEGQDAAS